MAPGNIRKLPRTVSTQVQNSSVPQPMNASNPVRRPSTRSPHSSATQPTNATNPEALAPVRNIRKSTVNNHLKKYRKATNNARPRIEIESGMGSPLGEWAQTFITEINIIARQNAPLFCHDWRTLTMAEKRDIFEAPILDKFDIDLHLTHVEDAVYRYIGIRLRDFRSTLHGHYKSIEGDARVKRTRPYKDVSQENWETICDWFEDPVFQQKSAKNTQSRKAPVVPHCAGSLSFVRFQANKGLDRIALYEQTHFSKDRDAWVAPLAQERHEAMVVRRDETTSENSPPPNETSICNEILGVRRGYTCGLGHGVMPPSYSRRARDNPAVGELQRNVEEANRRLEAAERHNEETERLRVESERQNAELRAQVQALQSFQARMESFMAQMSQMQ